MYSGAPSTLWSFLSSIQAVHKRSAGDVLFPLGEFWESLLPSLAEAPIVYTESGKWLAPNCTRIPTGSQEEDAVDAFQEIGIEIVHRDLWRNSRNLLRGSDVVYAHQRLGFFNHFKERGYADGRFSCGNL